MQNDLVALLTLAASKLKGSSLRSHRAILALILSLKNNVMENKGREHHGGDADLNEVFAPAAGCTRDLKYSRVEVPRSNARLLIFHLRGNGTGRVLVWVYLQAEYADHRTAADDELQ